MENLEAPIDASMLQESIQICSSQSFNVQPFFTTFYNKCSNHQDINERKIVLQSLVNWWTTLEEEHRIFNLVQQSRAKAYILGRVHLKSMNQTPRTTHFSFATLMSYHIPHGFTLSYVRSCPEKKKFLMTNLQLSPTERRRVFTLVISHTKQFFINFFL